MALAASAVVVTSWNGSIKAVESSPEYKQPAYAYQTEAWLYFNVSYARNVLAYVDPSRAQSSDSERWLQQMRSVGIQRANESRPNGYVQAPTHGSPSR